jgi:glutathione S-transferase
VWFAVGREEWAEVLLKKYPALDTEEESISLIPEASAILEALAEAHPSTLIQAKLVELRTQEGKNLLLSERTISKYLKILMEKNLAQQPLEPQKGYTITRRGLSLIGRG